MWEDELIDELRSANNLARKRNKIEEERNKLIEEQNRLLTIIATKDMDVEMVEVFMEKIKNDR